LSQTNFNLTKSEIKIGRNNKDIVNDIPVEDREVSRSHAKIVYRNQQYFIQDLGSSTGTAVNGVKLKAFQETAIQNGAEIAVGPRVKFKFISMRLPFDPGVTLDDSSQDEIRPEDDDPHRTLFDY
jgi:pSer/pThr/pTyr-binding forkhead associated (FHA) protein